MNIGVSLVVFCILGIIFLSADNKRLSEWLKYEREHPDE